MAQTVNRKPEWMFYLGWVVLGTLSMPIAWNILWAIMSQITRAVGDTIQVAGQTHITEDLLYMYILLPVLGLVTGSLQSLWLRRYLSRMGGWIVATFLGWLLLAVVFGFLSYLALFPTTVSPALAFVLAFLLPAGSFGLFQWLVLRQGVRHAALWILASALGWGIPLLSGPISSQQQVLTVVLLPPVAGSIAWWLLLDKLPQRKSNGENTPSSRLRKPSVPLGAD